MSDWSVGEYSGVDLTSSSNGIWIAGWYDSFVGIEGGFISWEELDTIRKNTKRRKPFHVEK